MDLESPLLKWEEQMRKCLFTVLIFLLVILLFAAIIIYSGIYSVSAQESPGIFETAFFGTVMDQSVKYHAHKVKIDTTASIKSGELLFNENCVLCHGSSQRKPTAIGIGLHPDPPDLSESVSDWNMKEIKWIVKNGVKMTGMPSFGKSYSDSTIDMVTVFVKRSGSNATEHKDEE